MGVLFSLALMGLITWWLVHEIRKMSAEARSRRAHPARGDKAVTSGGLALVERFKPSRHPEPSETDKLVAAAPHPKDPFGNTKEREVRRILAEVQAEGERWQAPIPTVAQRCYLCGGNRFPIAGVLACRNCDHLANERQPA